MGASTTLGSGVPVHSRVGGCGPAAPYLQHCCYCVQPRLQCGSAPGPRQAGQCMRRGAGPARLRAFIALTGPPSPPAPSGIAARSRGGRAVQPGQGARVPVSAISPLPGHPSHCMLGNPTTMPAITQARARCWEQRDVYSGWSRARQTQQGALVLSSPWLLARRRNRSSGT